MATAVIGMCVGPVFRKPVTVTQFSGLIRVMSPDHKREIDVLLKDGVLKRYSERVIGADVAQYVAFRAVS